MLIIYWHRSIADESIADLEKEKTMKELELKELLNKNRTELSQKDISISALRDRENEQKKLLEQISKEKEEITRQLKSAQEELSKITSNTVDIERLTSKLKTESLLKQQAVNKLAEIMNRKDINTTGNIIIYKW